eukprot:1159970-Pelagomonas_calceolata.AAC.7
MNANLQSILAQYNSSEARSQEKKLQDEKRRKKEEKERKQAVAKGGDTGGKQLKSKLKVKYGARTSECGCVHCFKSELGSAVPLQTLKVNTLYPEPRTCRACPPNCAA